MGSPSPEKGELVQRTTTTITFHPPFEQVMIRNLLDFHALKNIQSMTAQNANHWEKVAAALRCATNICCGDVIGRGVVEWPSRFVFNN